MVARDVVLAAAVALLAALPYARVYGYAFVNYDDTLYVTANPVVQQGLTRATASWALTTTDAANWHPLTWWSHMLDVQLFGLAPGSHHLTSVLLHALNAALLFLVLRRLTDAPWRSALVAAVFGVHPLAVESVAWIGQRKTVLCTSFALLALWSYAGWIRRGGVVRGMLVVLWFAASLLAKPMFVTLPFVLLLLDHWPLARATPLARRVLEKTPLLLLCAASSVVTYLAQEHGGAMRVTNPLDDRIRNAVVAYAQYVRAAMWPADLAVLYPLPAEWPLPTVAVALALLGGLTALAVAARRQRPAVLIGWLLFLGTLVPMIGLVQVGYQARADRYMYVPLVGLAVMVVWGIPDGWPRPLSIVGAGLAVLGLLVISARQAPVWRDSRSLFTHSVAVAPGSPVAHQNLAMALLDDGEVDAALAHYQAALALDPRFAGAYTGLGAVYARQGKPAEARQAFEQALAIAPTLAAAHASLARLLAKEGQLEQARTHLEQAIAAEPATPEFHYALALVYDGERKHAEAVAAYREAVRLQPHYPEAWLGLGNALSDAHAQAEAIAAYRTAIALLPTLPLPKHNLAWLLLAKPDRTAADVTEAIALLDEANRLTDHEDPRMLDTLAVAYAINRQFDRALETDTRALAAARARGDPGLVDEIRQNLDRFEQMRAATAGATS